MRSLVALLVLLAVSACAVDDGDPFVFQVPAGFVESPLPADFGTDLPEGRIVYAARSAGPGYFVAVAPRAPGSALALVRSVREAHGASSDHSDHGSSLVGGVECPWAEADVDGPLGTERRRMYGLSSGSRYAMLLFVAPPEVFKELRPTFEAAVRQTRGLSPPPIWTRMSMSFQAFVSLCLLAVGVAGSLVRPKKPKAPPLTKT